MGLQAFATADAKTNPNSLSKSEQANSSRRTASPRAHGAAPRFVQINARPRLRSQGDSKLNSVVARQVRRGRAGGVFAQSAPCTGGPRP